MAGAATMVDAENAVRTYLLTAEVQARLTNSSSTGIKVFTYQFNSDAPRTCIMVRDAGGSADAYVRLDTITLQVWARSDSVATAKTLISRLDDELHMLGPKAISDTVFCNTMLRNTGKQRFDDPDSQLVKYFIVYNAIMRRVP